MTVLRPARAAEPAAARRQPRPGGPRPRGRAGPEPARTAANGGRAVFPRPPSADRPDGADRAASTSAPERGAALREAGGAARAAKAGGPQPAASGNPGRPAWPVSRDAQGRGPARQRRRRGAWHAQAPSVAAGILLAVPAATAGRTPARSQFLPGPRTVRRGPRAVRAVAKFSRGLPAPAGRSAAPGEAAEPVRPSDPAPRESRSRGTLRGRDGLRWSSPVPSNRSFGTRRGMPGAR